jgi:SPOR domain
LTTKKSKPASLTSSLLARKGEAEPATAPYSIPEAGRQRSSEATPGKGNGNGAGGDLGHALSGLSASGEKPARPEISENGMHSQSVRAAEPPRQPEAPEADSDADALGSETVRPEAEVPYGEIHAVEPEPVPEAEEPPSAEEIFIESAVAEEVLLDEAVIEASVHDSAVEASAGETDSPAGASGDGGETPATAAAAAPSGGDAGGPEKTKVDREAVRDARLLRFVYAMAALTGIVAIVLYAGGWLRDVPKQQMVEAPAAPAAPGSAATTETPATAPMTESTASTSGSDNAGAVPGIPVAPPVAPVDGKPGMPESGVTTGGPAKSAMETTPPEPSVPTIAATPVTPPGDSAGQMSKMESGSAAPSAEMSTSPPESAAKRGIAPAASESAAKTEMPASAPGESQTAKAEAEPVVPTPAAPEAAPKVPAVTEPVREVPNMRVLAPAMGRPKPAETAPSTETATTPKVSAEVPKLVVPPTPSETQTASVPKTAPPKAGDGHYRVQLASVSSDAVAKREWARLQKVYPAIFGDKTLVVEKKEIAGRGTFFRVQAGGYASLDEARSVCTDLKAKKQGCLPVKR